MVNKNTIKIRKKLDKLDNAFLKLIKKRTNLVDQILKNKKFKISMDQAYDIIKRPITTEKSTNLQQFNQYTFVVSKNSNSTEIKNAIQMIFKVKVNNVNTSILRGKGKTFKGQYGFRKDVKKAIITLEEGNTIDSSLEIK